jgi:hypothetical protein
MDGREFSLLLPEGKQVACKSPMLGTAIADAIRANNSRDARGLPLATLLHRATGRRFEVPPGSGLTTLYTQICEALGPQASAPPAHAKNALQGALAGLRRAHAHLPEHAAEIADLAQRTEALLATLEPA